MVRLVFCRSTFTGRQAAGALAGLVRLPTGTNHLHSLDRRPAIPYAFKRTKARYAVTRWKGASESMKIIRFSSAERYEPEKDWRRVSLCQMQNELPF